MTLLAPSELLTASSSVSQALHVIRAHLGMDIAFVSEFLGDHRVFRHVDAKGTDAPLRVGDSLPLEEGYCKRVVDGSLPELIPDTASVPAAAALPITAALPIGAHLSVPIRLADGRLYGTFCCFSYAPDRSLNQRDLHMMRAFAEIAALQIDRDLEAVRRREEKVSRIRAAIDEGRISILYQPIYRLEDNQVAGLECLARFSDPISRSPDRWFNEAAEVGLGVELEVAALKIGLTALRLVPEGVYIAVNVSPETILSGVLTSALHGLSIERVVLEVTEHAPVDDYARLASAVAPLRKRGLRLAIDDAGAGYASLRHILSLKPDLIKLDISLIRNIHQDADKRALATALVKFAAQARADVVAEGVESPSELLILRTIGARYAQGYLLDRPMPLLQAERLCCTDTSEPQDTHARAVVPGSSCKHRARTKSRC